MWEWSLWSWFMVDREEDEWWCELEGGREWWELGGCEWWWWCLKDKRKRNRPFQRLYVISLDPEDNKSGFMLRKKKNN